jgi:DNA repair protein RecN (Recombination protein N)
MLTDLRIQNFAIIDQLHVPFGPGLTVLTGETGAGKSIIIDAVDLLLGGRASADLVRTGAEEAVVEALFDLAGREALVASLTDAGFPCAGELVVRRIVARSGRNRAFLNGGLATLAQLAEITRQLVNIYGQHESQTLLRADNQLRLVDGFAGLGELRAAYGAVYAACRTTREELRRLEEGEREAARRLDLLAFQADEIGRAALVPGEEEELETERRLLVHGEKLALASQEAYELLYAGDGAILGGLQRVRGLLAELRAIDGSLAPLAEAAEGATLQLEDAALALRDYAARVEADPARLQAVDDRLDLIRRLQKKYAPTIGEILAYGARVEEELVGLRNREGTRDELARRLRELEEELLASGEELSGRRQVAATALQEALERELRELAMPQARFAVALERTPEPRADGLERAEFLLAPNPGEESRPMARIASGGELSRLMLALKQVLPESDVPTLVFDEVDAGIGGATAALVGKKLHRVARRQQVLCITHLPPVAACADHHCRVEKRVVDGRTATAVEPLDGEERVREMARMLAGTKVTDTTLQHAVEMIAEARRDA